MLRQSRPQFKSNSGCGEDTAGQSWHEVQRYVIHGAVQLLSWNGVSADETQNIACSAQFLLTSPETALMATSLLQRKDLFSRPGLPQLRTRQILSIFPGEYQRLSMIRRAGAGQ